MSYSNYRSLLTDNKLLTPSAVKSHLAHQFSDEDFWKVDLLRFLDDWFDGSDSIFVNTSGSTGSPSVISVKKDAMVNSAMQTIQFFGLQRNMSALLALPVSFIAGKMMVVRALVGGMNLITLPPLGNPLQEVSIPVDFAAFTPMQMTRILNEKNASGLNLLHTVIIGGGRVDQSLDGLLQKQLFQAWETYGMTETLSHVALRRINGDDRQSAFHALPGVKLDVDDRGCLLIHAPGIADDVVKTNDLAEIHSDGSMTIKGRIDNVINTGGIKVFPEEIEHRIRNLIDKNFIVTSQSHPVLGEQVVLVIEGEDTGSSDLLKEIQKLVTKFELPRKVVFLNEFPRTESGKIQRFKIREAIVNL